MFFIDTQLVYAEELQYVLGRAQLTDYTQTLFVCLFIYNNYIYSYNFFSSKNTFLKLLISLECKYNKLQFGIKINCIEASTQKLCISTLCHVYNKNY